jgi:hypothetical protein
MKSGTLSSARKTTRHRRRWLLLVSALFLLLAMLPAGMWMLDVGYCLKVLLPEDASPIVTGSRNDSGHLELFVVYGLDAVSATHGHSGHSYYGFGHYIYPKIQLGSEGHLWFAPYWSYIVLLLVASWDCYRLSMPRKGQPVGCCQKCGYDLRAHQAGEKCPECGTVIGDAGEGGG